MGSGNDEHPPRNAEWHRGLDTRLLHGAEPPDTRLLHGAEPPAAESVEQYLWLHEHIERLRDDKRPTPAGELAPEEVRAYQIAALLRAAALGAAIPDPTFVASLHLRLREELAAGAESLITRPSAVDTQSPVQAIGPRGAVSRRALIGAGIGAAAVGLAAGAVFVRANESAPSTQPSVALVPRGSGVWVAVAAVQDIPLGGVKRFTTEAIVGFVRQTLSGFSALSGVCTHMGCLLQWNGPARTFDCPCHGGRFAEDGNAASTSPV